MSRKKGLPYYPDDSSSSLGGRYNMLLAIGWVDPNLLKAILYGCAEQQQKRDLIFTLMSRIRTA